MLEVRLLGTFRIKSGKRIITLASRPAQSLFAFLILHSGTSYRREKLAGMLWPESTEDAARDYLRHALWRIRKALQTVSSAAYLKADDLTVAFDASSDYWLDVAALGDADETGSGEELAEALSAYAGELLPGFYDEWAVLERDQIQSVYERKIACLLELMQKSGRWPEILEWAERWISHGQRPEAAYRYLMMAHAAQGDMVKAAAAYERCTRSLAEFGLEPSASTRQLYDELKNGSPGRTYQQLAPSKAGAPRTVITNIPTPLTSFVGREREIVEIVRLMAEKRLLTLTGSGGVGKTRLAIQVANQLIKKYKDGVFWVGLVELSDASLIPQEIARALRVHEVPPEPLIESVKNHLRAKDALLILDNCEHLIRACARYSEDLLGACPKLKILATSIEALGLFNESTWQVPSLPLPAAQGILSVRELGRYASIELFHERAEVAKSGFELNEENAKSVTKICQRLDGIPLAIELAAARTKVLTVDEIAARLDDRFSLLTSGSRTAIPRHQTLRATIDWSHELLSEAERVLFRRLAAFAGGFTVEAAETVCSGPDLKAGEILDVLGRLADKSLVIVESGSLAGETRYRLLETIRQYALERLLASGEAHEIRQKHADFYLHLAEEAEPAFYGSASPRWFRRLDKDIDNIRSAVEWCTASGRADLALRILGALVYFWFAHGLVGSEWNDRVQEALARPEGRERTLARAKALNGIGFMYWADIYPTEKRSELEEALSIGKEWGDPWNTAVALRNLGLHENILGNYNAAQSLLEESLTIWREMGPAGNMGKANTLIFLGDVAFNQGDRPWAQALLEESAAILTEPGDLNFRAYSVRRLGHLAWLNGDFKEAKDRCTESLRLNQEVGDPRGVIACVAGFAAIAMAQSDFERAAVLMAAVEAQLAAISVKLLYVDRIEYERNLATLRERVRKKTLDQTWARGRAMSLEKAIAFALEEM